MQDYREDELFDTVDEPYFDESPYPFNEPTGDELDEMWADDVYLRIDRTGYSPDTKWTEWDVEQLKNDLQELKELNDRGLLAKYPPKAMPVVSEWMDMDAPLRTPDERAAELRKNLANRYADCESTHHPELYAMQTSLFTEHPDESYREYLADMDVLLSEQVQDTIREMAEFGSSEKGMSAFDLMGFVTDHIRQDKRITPEDIAVINHVVQNEYQLIQDDYRAGYLDVDEKGIACETSERVRKQYGFGPDDENLPAYVEAEIGSAGSTPVSELQRMHSSAMADVERQYAEDKELLYDEVYALQRFDFSDVKPCVTGWNADGSKRNPTLISFDTRKMLGKEYEAYEAKRFEEHLAAVKARHAGKDTSLLMGIDVSKHSVCVQMPEDVPVKSDVVHSKEPAKEPARDVSRRELPACGKFANMDSDEDTFDSEYGEE